METIEELKKQLEEQTKRIEQLEDCLRYVRGEASRYDNDHIMGYITDFLGDDWGEDND